MDPKYAPSQGIVKKKNQKIEKIPTKKSASGRIFQGI
jgi:hypothetical protein